MPVNTTYDADADALYIQLSDAKPFEGGDAGPLTLHYAAEGGVVGLEALAAREVFAPGGWTETPRPDTTFDPEADAVYIHLGEGDVAETEEVAPNVMLDFDAEGRVVGVEVLTASKVLAPGDWRLARPPGAAHAIAAE